MRSACWKLTALCGLALGCSSGKGSDTSIAVYVWSDMAVPKQIDTITVEVRGATETSPVLTLQPTSAAGTSPVAQFTLVPAGTDLSFDLYVTGLLANNVVVRQDARSYCIPGERRAIAIFLSRACTSQACSKGATTCWYGTCVDIVQTPQAYDPNNPTKPQAPVVVPDASIDASDAAAVIDAADLHAIDAIYRDLAPDIVPDVPSADTLDASDDASDTSGTNRDLGNDIEGAGGITGMGGNATGTGGAGGTGGTTTTVTSCPSLTKPTNGDVTMPSTAPGATASYTCDPEFALSGNTSVKCQADGTWSGLAPACVRDCHEPPAPTSGTVSKTGTTAGATATYACQTGFLPASATITCQDDGTWTGTSPTCTVVSCPGLTAPANGSLDVTTTTYESTASFGCSPGYTLKGSKVLKCQADGNWSDKPPACAAVDCGALAAPTNGSVRTTPDTTYGSTATYTCGKGYAPSGGSPRQCQADKTWSGTAPTCEVNCGQPLLPTHGGAVVPTSGTWKGATIQYFCYGDLQLYPSSPTSATCQADGTWSGTVPNCLCLGSATSGWGTACQITCPAGATVTGVKGCGGSCWEAETKC